MFRNDNCHCRRVAKAFSLEKEIKSIVPSFKKIIVATDFSVTGQNAVQYAITLAKQLSAHLTLLHAYNLPTLSPIESIYIGQLNLKEVKDFSEVVIKAMAKKINSDYDISCDSICEKANLTDLVKKYAVKNKCDLFVIGLSKINMIKNLVLGNQTLSILDWIKIPVLVVPENIIFRKLTKILFASDFNHDGVEVFSPLKGLAEKNKAEIIFAHVNDLLYNTTFTHTDLNDFRKRTAKKINYRNTSYEIVNESHIANGLNYIIAKTKADLACMVKSERALIIKLFSRSVTNQLAFYSHVPLLIFPSVSDFSKWSLEVKF